MTRFSNFCKAVLSYTLSRHGHIRAFRHKPLFMSVEPANYCQLHCPQCRVGIDGRKPTDRQHLTIEQFQTMLDAFGKELLLINFYFQGEPTLNPQLPELIRLAHEKKIHTIVSTNAQSVTQETADQLVSSGLDKVIISLDGMTQKVYEQYRRGGKVDKVFNAIAYFRKAKDRQHAHCRIELQCLALCSNEPEWPLMQNMYRRLGADAITFKTAQIEDPKTGIDILPTDPALSRYEVRDGKLILKKTLRRRCWRAWVSCVVSADGYMLPCCYDKRQEHRFNDEPINTPEDALTAWTSTAAMQFRQDILNHREQITICQNCNE